MKVGSGGTSFVNSAGRAGPIRTEDSSFDAPKRRNDGDGGHVAPRARGTCHVPPREPFEKKVVRLQPKQEVAGSPNFQVRSVLVWIMCHWENQPRGVKIVSRGNFIFSAFCPLARTPLDLGSRDPKFGTRVNVSKGYPNMHNLGVQKIGGQKFGFFYFVKILFFSFFIIRHKKNWKWHFLKFEILNPLIFWPPKLYIFWKPLLHSILVPSFVKFHQRVSELEGIRLKHKIVLCGPNFDPSGSSLAWHVCHTRAHLPWKFEVFATSPALHIQTSHPRSFG